MGVVLVLSGAVEPITVHLVDTGAAGVSGLSPTLTIRRADATSWWNGSALVSSGVELAMIEVDSSDAPGDYRYNFETSGADSGKYVVEVTLASVSGLAANLPAAGELQVSTNADLLSRYRGFIWVDNLNPITGGGRGVTGTQLGVNGVQSNPCIDIADAQVLADALNIRAFKIRGTVTLTQNYDDFWVFEGFGSIGRSNSQGRIILNGQSFNGIIRNLAIQGTLGGDEIQAIDCDVSNGITDAAGTFMRCAVGNTWTVAPFLKLHLVDCYTPERSVSPLVLDLTGASFGVVVAGHRGNLTLTDCSEAGQEVVINIDGALTLGSNNDDGSITVTGRGTLSGVVTGSATLDRSGFFDITQLQRLHGENVRTRLYFPTDAVVSGVAGAIRNVPVGSAAHMEVEVKPEVAAAWGAPQFTYFVVFNYGGNATAGDAPRSSSIAQSAPTDGTFNTVPYPI